VFSEDDGVIEPLAGLGDTVARGQPVARVYAVGRTGIAPLEYAARMDGLLTARHSPGLVKTGDCIAVVARRVAGSS
jgi:N-alpha-acetyl-L-2,4-diaminobutyrate deacetylase